MNILNPDRHFTFTVHNHVFSGLHATPNIETEIDVDVAIRLKGQPLNTLPQSTVDYNYMLATLNKVITTVKPALDYDDWGDISDTDFVLAVFRAYEKSRKEFREALKKNTERAGEISEKADGRGAGSVPDAKVSTPEQDAKVGVPGADRVSGDGRRKGRGNGSGTPGAGRPFPKSPTATVG